MAVSLESENTLLPVGGVRLASTYCGIRKAEKEDLVLIEVPEGASVAAVFTRNAFCAAPVVLAKQHIKKCTPRYLLINAGNANAGTGSKGMQAAQSSCRAVAEHADVSEEQVLPFSTGVIGEYLPVEKIQTAMSTLVDGLSESGWEKAAAAIMTTDTLPKAISRQLSLSSGETVTVTGMSKGAGMICPDMATMLAYIATDAAVESQTLQSILNDATKSSFNSITVDGDTSTNDACVLIASGYAKNTPIKTASKDYELLLKAIQDVMQWLAQAIIRDAEGATKFVTINTEGATSEAEARQLGYTIAHSPLVKTALFASDPNWGRILAAIGRAGLKDLDLEKISFSLNGVSIVKAGMRDPSYTEEQGAKVMAEPEICIDIELGRGTEKHTVWTCDLGYDYVRINAEYRT